MHPSLVQLRLRLANLGVNREQEDIADFLDWMLSKLEQDLNDLRASLQAAAPPTAAAAAAAGIHSRGSADSPSAAARGDGSNNGSGGSVNSSGSGGPSGGGNGGSLGDSGIISSIFGGLQRETRTGGGRGTSMSDSAFKIVRVQILDKGVHTLEQALQKSLQTELIGE